MGRAAKAVRVRVSPVLPQGQLDTENLQRYADARLKSLTRSGVHTRGAGVSSWAAGTARARRGCGPRGGRQTRSVVRRSGV